MSGRLDLWLSRLQLSPRSRRVLTEAALDWRHEVATAPTLTVALWRHCRAGVGFLRALSSVCLESLGTAGRSTWLPRFLFWGSVCLAPTLRRTMHAPGIDTPMHLMSSVEIVLRAVLPWSPHIAALTILTGPSRKASPVLGLVFLSAMVGLVGAYVAPSVWTAFARAENRGFIDIHYIYPGPTYVPAYVAFTAGFALFADRVRIDDHRLRTTFVALAQFAVFFVAMRPFAWVLQTLGMASPTEVGQLPISIVMAAVPFALWFRLLRRQERRAVLG